METGLAEEVVEVEVAALHVQHNSNKLAGSRLPGHRHDQSRGTSRSSQPPDFHRDPLAVQILEPRAPFGSQSRATPKRPGTRPVGLVNISTISPVMDQKLASLTADKFSRLKILLALAAQTAIYRGAFTSGRWRCRNNADEGKGKRGRTTLLCGYCSSALCIRI